MGQSTNKQQHILETALTLFAREGYQRIGVDRVALEAGVNKMTLYKYYPSKSYLVVEVLRERDRRFRASMADYAHRQTGVLRRLCAIFAWHHRWFQQRDFHGCMFINAAAEFHHAEVDIRRVSADHKYAIHRFLVDEIGTDINHDNATSLATALALLLDGAIVAAQVMGDQDAANKAWDVAIALLPKQWGIAPTLGAILDAEDAA